MKSSKNFLSHLILSGFHFSEKRIKLLTAYEEHFSNSWKWFRSSPVVRVSLQCFKLPRPIPCRTRQVRKETSFPFSMKYCSQCDVIMPEMPVNKISKRVKPSKFWASKTRIIVAIALDLIRLYSVRED